MGNTSSKFNPPHSYYAFFDLDHTLSGEVSGKALAKGAIRKGLLGRRDVIKALKLSLSYKLQLEDPLKVVSKMVLWTNGMPEQKLKDLCNEVSLKIIIPSIYPQVMPELKYHRNNNAGLVILSSALSYVCRVIADHLEMDDILCSRIEIDEGIVNGRPLGRLCFGEEKLERLKAYCSEKRIDPRETWYYADSITDLPVLEKVGFPVCVNPDRKLLKAANKNGWRICHWNY